MKVLISAATPFELAGTQSSWPAGRYAGGLDVTYLVAGVGPAHTATELTTALLTQRPDLLLNIGLAGALDPELQLGEVVQVAADSWGDLGVEERDGSFTSAHALGLVDGDAAPYADGGWLDVSGVGAFAKTVRGVTVSTVHGSAASIEAFRERTEAQVETMEGAAACLVALRHGVDLVQLRAISNYVEPRDRDAWVIEEALAALAEVTDGLLSAVPGALAARSARRQLGR